MAYLDNRRSWSPASLGVAVLLNGGTVLALMLIAPQIAGPAFDPPIEIFPIDPAKPVKPVPPESREKPKQAPSQVTASRPVRNGPLPLSPNPIVPAAYPGPPQPILPPADPIIPMPDPPAPVLIAPRVDPRFASLLQPDYPPDKVREGVEGRVELRVLVGADGRVKSVEIASATDPAFAEATRRQALKKWRFLPGTREGVAVDAWRIMAVRFEIPA